MEAITEYLAAAKRQFEQGLAAYLKEYPCKYEPLWSAVEYALTSGGKRVRPALVYLGADFCGADAASVEHIAQGLEMIHNYSLVHDDMPCMDDDALRHGKPSVHKAYGEGIAMLAGDALLNMAFERLLSVEDVHSYKAASYIAKASGMCGMVGGQCLDLSNIGGVGADYEKIVAINRLKTSALLRAALCGGAVACGCSGEELESLENYADCLGEIFQIVDDILDITSDSATMGKEVNQDCKNGKVTYASINGVNKARAYIKQLNDKAKGALSQYGVRADKLNAFSDYLLNRAF
ncbi:MAG: polyprenyl synthetase family protein [Clostridia bacterium]|nr:polyprenyl synthetase family protein [Clostridia bacterium]